MKMKEEGAERVTLPEFLSEVSLLTDQDTDKDKDGNKVTLMTIHAAKGLEFRTVFIVGLEEELFPSPFAETARELEEERRLFYVAITRAEEQCFISYSKSRFKNGKTNFANPSRFLKDIDKQMSTQRKNRGKMVRVALVGYTNVGKSTIMNLMSKSDVFAENKLFATLDTTVRKVIIDYKNHIINLDTASCRQTLAYEKEFRTGEISYEMQNGLFDSFNPEVVQDYFANGEPFASLDPSYMTVDSRR
jgi:ATP-dependent helicase/DNAse subunit B